MIRAALILGISVSWVVTSSGIVRDVVDETYGNGIGQISLASTYTWSFGSAPGPSEVLSDGSVQLTHGAGIDYATRPNADLSFQMPGGGTWTLEIKMQLHGALGGLFQLQDNTGWGTTITLNSLFSETVPHPNTIGDYNQRVVDGTNIEPPGFDGSAVHVYRFERFEGSAVEMFVDDVSLGSISCCTGAQGDGMQITIGFGGGLSPGPGTSDVYYVKVAGPPPVAESTDVTVGDTMAIIPAGAFAESRGSQPIAVGSARQLLIDDLFFEAAAGVSIKVHPARKTGEKNLQREKEWESATPNWFNVMEDGGAYRMWYECYDIDGWPTGDDTSFCYAESNDGINWTRPNLGLYEYKGSKDNNILFRLMGPEEGHSRVHGTGVFKDPHAPPGERYKAVGQGIWPGLYDWPSHRITGMYSADGLRWTRYPRPICEVHADSQYSGFWDESTETYVIFGRVGGRGRSLGRSEGENFKAFEPLQFVMQSDDDDPQPCDLYNSAALKYPYAANAYFMFISLFQHDPQTLDIRLAVSRDGKTWTRPDRDTPFIPIGGEGEFDSGSIYMGQGILRVGDELWQYYGGSPLNHADGELENLVKPGNGRVYSRVITRLDGYLSARAGPEGGSFRTPPLVFEGNVLKLNVKVAPGGSVRVGLFDAEGQPVKWRSLDDCLPITGDHINTIVQWKTDGDVSGRAGQPTRLHVDMKDADLYAFQFDEDYPYRLK